VLSLGLAREKWRLVHSVMRRILPPKPHRSEVPLAPVGERRSGLKMVGGHPLTS
jgi:hypothetical protein